MLLTDELQVHEDIIDVVTTSGGGARGIFAWTVMQELKKFGYEADWTAGSSTGCIVAFLEAKGLIEEGDRLYRKTYEEGSKNIFESDMAKVVNGKLEFSFWNSLTKIFKLKKVKSLMTNQGLYETFLALDKMKPGFEKPMFFNTALLKTGAGIQHSATDFLTSEDRCMALTASTSMPVILPWWNYAGYEVAMDGGAVKPLPFGQMFARMEPGKSYRFWNILCNRPELMPASELANIFQIGGRTLDLMLNTILNLEIGRTNDKNYTSQVIWPIAEELDRRGITDIADQLRKALGYRFMPIHNLVYPDDQGVFSFTMDSYHEQIASAKKLVADYVAANKL